MLVSSFHSSAFLYCLALAPIPSRRFGLAVAAIASSQALQRVSGIGRALPLFLCLAPQAASYGPFAFFDEVYRLLVESSKSLWMRASLLRFSLLFKFIRISIKWLVSNFDRIRWTAFSSIHHVVN
jgi:hypothetical protein